MLGAHIGKKSKIRFGTIILADRISIGDNVKIGPFTYIKTEEISVGDNSVIKSLSFLSTRRIKFGNYVHIAPLSIIMSEFTENSLIEIGDHSRIFPFSWMDPGEGIKIGSHVSLSDHSFIFTHGVWSDYLDGAPVTYGPVTVHDNVWLALRVSILPNVEIGKNSIVGTNSVVNKSLGENVLAAGSPAKVIKENVLQNLSEEEKTSRAKYILERFSAYINFKFKVSSKVSGNSLVCNDFKISIDEDVSLKNGDLLFLVNKKLQEQELKIFFSRRISVLNHNNKHIKIVSHNKNGATTTS
jgi:acetyltransferase-like isoleucine patch superfamily enzyme